MLTPDYIKCSLVHCLRIDAYSCDVEIFHRGNFFGGDCVGSTAFDGEFFDALAVKLRVMRVHANRNAHVNVGAGISDGAKLDAAISREEFITMLYRYAGEPEVNNANLSR